MGDISSGSIYERYFKRGQSDRTGWILGNPYRVVDGYDACNCAECTETESDFLYLQWL